MCAFKTSLSIEDLTALAAHQVNTAFPDGQRVLGRELMAAAALALSKVEYCFSHINNRYFFDGINTVFDHLHGDQYAMWLYWLAHDLAGMQGSQDICKKLFLLNKALHGCDIYFEIKLPAIFLLVHPVGTVLGRGKYDDYFLVYQGCSIGSNHGVFPTLGRYVTLHPGSAVLGQSMVGEGCSIAAKSLLLDRALHPNNIYIGEPRNYLIRPKTEKEAIWRNL